MSAYTEPNFIYNNSQDCINQIQDRIASLFDTSTSTELSVSTGLKITNPSNGFYVAVAQGGLDTNNSGGITINPASGYTTACNYTGDIDMNLNGIINCSSVSSSQGDITISSLGTTNISSDDILTITGTTGVFIEATNDLISLNGQNGVYINQVGSSGGDGQIYANTFNGYLNGTASQADTATYATSSGSSLNTQSIQVNQNTANATNYITFSDGYATSLRSLRSNDGLTYNPSTNVLTATTFSGNATTATTSTNSNISVVSTGLYYPNFTTNTTGSQAVLASSSLTYNATTNNLSATTFTGALSGNATTATNATNSTNAINCSTTSTSTSGTYYPVFVSNNITGNYPNLVGTMTYNPSTNSITANTFNGALSGTATNSTNASITSDNTAGTYYIPFTKTSGTGNKPLFQDDTTGPLTYNPSTGNMSATSYTITTAPSTANNAGRFGQIGLVYLSTSQFSIVGSAVAQDISAASIFNSTYQNYRIILNSLTQVSFTAYPSYSLAGYLGTGVPTTGSLYGNELVSSAPALISAVYTAGATLSSAPLLFAVSALTNKQIIIEVENVGFANTAANVVGLKCKSFYGNPGVSGYSDRNIISSSLNGATITGLTIQQSSLGVGNNMTLQVVVYGYNTI